MESYLKKSVLIILILSLLITTTACGGGDNENEDVNDEEKVVEEADENVEDESVEDEDPDNGLDSQETDVGLMSIVKKKENLNLTAESGPFTITVTDAQVGKLETNEQGKAYYDDKDEISVVTLYIEVENNDEGTNSIYPDQGTLTTNTKEQVDADIMQSDSTGGDYIGEVIKEGNVFFILDSKAEEITSAKYIIGAPFDDDFERLGDDITFEIDF